MKTNFPKILFAAGLLIILAGCQVSTSALATPPPLTGNRASAAGASALVITQKPLSAGVQLVPVAASTGQPAAGFAPIDLGQSSEYAFSANREQLAFITQQTAACPTNCLHLLDLRTWKETLQPFSLKEESLAWPILAFNLQGTRLAVAFINQYQPTGGHLVLVDLAQARVMQQADFSANIQQMGFTPNGSLAVYGNLPAAGPGKESKMYITLYDGTSLQTLWNQNLDEVSYGTEFNSEVSDPTLGKYLNPAAVFSANNARLYIVTADRPTLVRVDFDGRSVQSSDIHPRQGLLERLLTAGASTAYAKALNGASKTGALSPDGKFLYVIGQAYKTVKKENGDYDSTITPLGLQMVDLSDGTEAATLATTATDVSVSLDGKTILLNGYDQAADGTTITWTDLADPATLKVSRRLVGEAHPARLLDGSLVYLSSDWSYDGASRMAVYDPGSPTPRSQRQWSSQESPTWVAIP